MKPKNARHNLKSQRRGKKSKTPTHEAKNESSIQIKGKQCLPRGFLISFNHEDLFSPCEISTLQFSDKFGMVQKAQCQGGWGEVSVITHILFHI